MIFLTVGAAGFHLFTAGYILLPAMFQRPLHWLFMSLLIFLIFPSSKNNKELKDKISFIDLILMVFTICGCIYTMYIFPTIIYRIGLMQFWDYVFGIMMIIAVLEATRRTLGLPLVIIAIVFILYAYFGEYLPGIFTNCGYSTGRIISQLYLSTDGIYGIPLGVSATIIYLFVFFASVLLSCGMENFITNIAQKFTRNLVGGAAKLAVISSMFFGMISGSAVANVVSTGNFTIPLMKKTGYSKKVSGAIEASASTGGQIMPPVMGAAAFIMAELTGVSYFKIALCAFLPASLYFLSVLCMVHLEAKKEHIGKIEYKKDLSYKKLLWPDGLFVLPIIMLVVMLSLQLYTITRIIFYTIFLTIVIALAIKKRREKISNVKAILEIVYRGTKNALAVAAGCACAGIVVGVVTLTGIGLKLTSTIMAVGGENTYLALFILMSAAIILGCGLPPSAAYILLAILGAPALVNLGFPIIASHLFLFYFVILSVVTPPVCLASYAAASLSGADPGETGWAALRFSFAGFVVPYIFIFSPALLGQGTIIQVILIFTISIIGIYSFAVAIIGWLYENLKVWSRILFFIVGILIMVPNNLYKLLGIVIFLITLLYFYFHTKNKKI